MYFYPYLSFFYLNLFLTYSHTLMKTPESTICNPHFRSAYGPKLTVNLECSAAEDRTMQSFKDECDINNIMARYQATGIIDHENRLPPVWGEVPKLDFHRALHLVLEAREKFEALPSQIRERFGNDPGRMMDFLKDPANRDEGVKLGLLQPPPEPQPTPPAKS